MGWGVPRLRPGLTPSRTLRVSYADVVVAAPRAPGGGGSGLDGHGRRHVGRLRDLRRGGRVPGRDPGRSGRVRPDAPAGEGPRGVGRAPPRAPAGAGAVGALVRLGPAASPLLPAGGNRRA